MARTAKTAETKTTKATAKKTVAPKAKVATKAKVAPKAVKTPKTPKVQVKKVEKPKPEFKTYRVFFTDEKDEEGKRKDIGTYPQGKQPKQAARKAITPIFMSLLNAKKDPKKIAAIEKYLDKNKKDKNGNPAKTPKYKEEMKKYEESLSKEFMDKYYLFYLIQKSPRIPREYRHYYYGMRQSINPDVKSYLTKVDPKLSAEDIKKLKAEGKELPKITIEEKDFNGKLIKDKNGNVIEIQIPHYEMRPVLGKDGKPIMEPAKKKNGDVKIGKDGKVVMVKKMEKIPDKAPRIISYKYTNVVAKLTKDFYEQHKAEFNLTADQEQELMNHFNHVRPPKIETKREKRAREMKEKKKEEKKAKEAAKKAAKKEKKAEKKAAAKEKKPIKKAIKKTVKKAVAAKKPAVKKAAAKK